MLLLPQSQNGNIKPFSLHSNEEIEILHQTRHNTRKPAWNFSESQLSHYVKSPILGSKIQVDKNTRKIVINLNFCAKMNYEKVSNI